jgi:1,4-dihydroxy-2-naphthoate polyprenyltransferase
MNQAPTAPISKIKAWQLAIRPKTLPASIAGVVTGIGVAISAGRFNFIPAVGALAVGILLQIASNLANDVFDYEKGTDTDARLGPTRVTQAGMLSPREVKTGLGVVIGLAALIGIGLAVYAGWPVLAIGLAAIISAILYTGGPYPLGYHGLGDLFVFLFFGLAAVCGTYYVQVKEFSALALWMAVPVGLLVVNLLVVNNLRDIPTDKEAGKFTIAILLGEKGSRIEYVILQVIAYLIPAVLITLGKLPLWAGLTWLTIPLAVKAARIVFSRTGKALNPGLGATSTLAMWYGVAFLVGMILANFIH